jgi:hypothetical protein
MHERVAHHEGPLYLLYWPRERGPALNSIADYGLALDDAGCKVVHTNISALMDQGMPLQLCPLTRKTP